MSIAGLLRFTRSKYFAATLFYLSAGEVLLAAVPAVPLYGMFQTQVISSSEFQNPFNYSEVDYQAIFRSPSDQIFLVHGFYDGKNAQNDHVFAIRFSPNVPGTWNFEVYDTFENKVDSGAFDVLDVPEYPHNHGQVKIDQANPRYLIHDDGNPHYWVGGKWISASNYGPKSKTSNPDLSAEPIIEDNPRYLTNAVLIAYLDTLADLKHNGILLKIGLFPLENDKLSWDLGWIKRGEWLVEEARKRGIYVQVNLFDTWSRDKAYYFKWNTSGLSQVLNVWNDGDDRYIKNYLQYIVSRFASFSNVYWELGNEMEHKPNNGQRFSKLANEKYIPWIREFDPYDLPIGLSGYIWKVTSVDIGFLHQTNRLPERDIDRPVIMNELVRYDLDESIWQKFWHKLTGTKKYRGLWQHDAINDPEMRYFYRRTFWKVFTHGGSGSSEATWLRLQHELTKEVTNVMMDHAQLAYLVETHISEINRMFPQDIFTPQKSAKYDISTRGNNNLLISYFDVGRKVRIPGGSLEINGLGGSYSLSWIDPLTGNVVKTDSHSSVDGLKVTHPPFYEDIVLVMERQT